MHRRRGRHQQLGDQQALIESWDGTSWTAEPTPVPADATFSGLTSVSCTSPTACAAIGNSDVGPFSEMYVTGLATPVNTALPTISGTATQGETLPLTDGSWTQKPTAVTHQWEDCNYYGGACQPILGETGVSYRLTAADVGDTICVQETARNADYTGGPVCSAPTAMVQSDSSSSTTSTTTTTSETTTTTTTSTTTSDTTSDVTTTTTTTKAATTTTSSTTLRAVLVHALNAHGRTIDIAALLGHDGYTFTFTAPTPGRLVITWQHTAQGAEEGATEQIAGAAIGVRADRKAIVRLRLTRTGRRLLKQARRLRLIATAVFTPVTAPSRSPAKDSP